MIAVVLVLTVSMVMASAADYTVKPGGSVDDRGQGKAVMMVSSEMPELIGICDRILVMSNGHMAGILERGKDFGGIENEQETIMRLAAQYV